MSVLLRNWVLVQFYTPTIHQDLTVNDSKGTDANGFKEKGRSPALIKCPMCFVL